MKGSALLWTQVVLAVFFTFSQAIKMLESTEGLSIMFFCCQTAFCVINLSLSANALKNATGTSRNMKVQSFGIYCMWTVFSSLHLVIALWRKTVWNAEDALLRDIVVALLAVIAIISYRRGLDIDNPWVKCLTAMSFKTVPQLMVAVVIWQHGASGWSPWFIIIGHLTIGTRIAQLVLSLREGDSEHTRASLVTEIGSEMSWIIATIAYIAKI